MGESKISPYSYLTMKTEKRNERDFQPIIMKALRAKGCYVYKNPQNQYTEKGRPDLTACVPMSVKDIVSMYGEDGVVGLYVAIEAKTPKKSSYDVTEAQKIVARKINKANGLWFRVKNDDGLKELLETLLLTEEDDDAIQ